jgi:hypothetical protein
MGSGLKVTHMKLIKILTVFVALISLQIAAAQWLNVPPPVEARMLMVAGPVPVTGSCTTANDSAIFDFTGGSSANVGYVWSGSASSASRFNLSATTTVTEYVWNIYAIDTPGTFTMALYTDNANTVGTVVSGTTKAQTISATGNNTFTLDTPKTGLSGLYWLVLTTDSASTAQLHYSGGGQTGYYIKDGVSYYAEQVHFISVMGCAE